MFYHPQGTCAISIHNGRSLARLVFFTAAPALGAWNESLNNVILSIPFHCLAGQSLRRMLCRAPILWRCRRFTVAGALVPFSPGRVPPEDSSLVWNYATLLQTVDSCPTISPSVCSVGTTSLCANPKYSCCLTFLRLHRSKRPSMEGHTEHSSTLAWHR
jgi:hypothetical protein